MSGVPQKCRNCKFFYLSEAGGIVSKANPVASVMGRCRRRAPASGDSTMEEEQRSRILGQPGNVALDFPYRYQNDWCGEYEPIGDNIAAVFSDWLEERGHIEAAKDLRSIS